MAVIIWSNTTPGDDYSMQSIAHSVRTMKESIASGLGESFYWPGSAASQGNSAASSGEMLLGAHRVMRLHDNTGDPIVGNAPNGYVALVSLQAVGGDHPESNVYLQHIGSENTHVIGSTGVEEVVAAHRGTVNVRSSETLRRWVVDEGTVEVTSADVGDINQAVTFNVTYGAPPWVFMSTNSAGGTSGVDNVTTTGFTSRFSSTLGTDPGTVIFHWRSEGTIDYA